MSAQARSDAAAAPAQGPEAVSAQLGRLGSVVVGVPDQRATASFLADALGFALAATDEGFAAACAGDYGPHGQVAIELRAAAALELRELVWEVSDDYDLDALAERLSARAVAVAVLDDGISFCDPAGIASTVLRGSARRAPLPPHDPLRPRRLGHVNLKAPDPPAAAAFYAQALGLRLSEQIGENLYFLRVGGEHHNIGLRGGARGGLHHVGLEIGGWHLYQPILDRLSDLGIALEYGPGRHRPGNNLFAYVCDPSSGLRLELFADMAQIPDASAHEPLRWEAGDRLTKTINRWGPTPPPSFLE